MENFKIGITIEFSKVKVMVVNYEMKKRVDEEMELDIKKVKDIDFCEVRDMVKRAVGMSWVKEGGER